MSEPSQMKRIEDRSLAVQGGNSLKIAVGSAYVFVCFFLCGPLFGMIAVFIGFGVQPTEFLDNRLLLAYPPALVVGGIQAYRCGLRVTDFLESEGYVPFRYVLESAFRVGFTPSSLAALVAFVWAWSSHNLWGLAYWPVVGFGTAMGVHLAAALGVSVMISPLMRRPKHHHPTT